MLLSPGIHKTAFCLYLGCHKRGKGDADGDHSSASVIGEVDTLTGFATANCKENRAIDTGVFQRCIVGFDHLWEFA